MANMNLMGYPTALCVCGCPESLQELREENNRMRTRIERLRGALKTASGRFLDSNDLQSADDCMLWAGDMEPSIMGPNVKLSGVSDSDRPA